MKTLMEKMAEIQKMADELPSKDEAVVGFGSLEVSQIKRWAEETAGEWNGKTERGEDKANCAKEIAEKCDELNALLEEISEYL